MELGRFGVWTFDFEDQPASLIRDEIQELDELGWPAIWFPEVGGREAMTLAGFLLANSTNITVVNGIAQVLHRDALRTYGAASLLAEAYPNRHLLGLGVGDARPGLKPMQVMREYLDELDQKGPIRRLLAAYGPKMLELARERADGAHTYHVPVRHTAEAREILGEAPFLGVEHAVLFEADPGKAREIAREHLHVYSTQKYNIAKYLRQGYTEADFADGGSDRLVDDLVFWGDLDTIVRKLQGHLDAGADHVGIQVIGIEPGRSAMPQWRRLAEALKPGVPLKAGVHSTSPRV
ncbi:TIGR03620 family F420-dependent LLM class oxidoreductase [Kribbella sp. NBC_01245]|uniref:TIGR03620 family F420-dependent LLM class oxidoreductase n=1 Tax=Kribbella sp. NBC_01245 TaxID=2903578 RepID=UPI002E2D31B4|nr:TIGR03620 family F420-dependent LLM class oxidoreductase [Kribbella sp. NBC_01245]